VLDHLQLPTFQVMMIGDSLEYDVEGANSAGIKGILLDRTNKYPNCQAPKICSLLDLLDQEGRIYLATYSLSVTNPIGEQLNEWESNRHLC